MSNTNLAIASHRRHRERRRLVPPSSFRWQHVARAGAAFDGLPQPSRTISRYIVPAVAVVLAFILIASIGAVVGVFPGLTGESETTPPPASWSPAPGAGTADGATAPPSQLLAPLAGETIAQRLKRIAQAASSPEQEADLLNALGVTCLSKAETKDAIYCFKKALSANPALVAAYNNLGAAMIEYGDTGSARAAYQSALKLQPDNSYTLRQLDRLCGNAIGTSSEND